MSTDGANPQEIGDGLRVSPCAKFLKVGICGAFSFVYFSLLGRQRKVLKVKPFLKRRKG